MDKSGRTGFQNGEDGKGPEDDAHGYHSTGGIFART